MRRGDIWWAQLPPPDGRRPVVLLSRDVAYSVRAAVTVAAITRTLRGIPVEVPLGREDGLPERCAANADVILTIPRELLVHRISTLSPGKLAEMEAAVRFALDL